MHNIHLASGMSFASEEGVSLLDAGIAAGVTLDHSCRSGRCNACKVRVVEGQTLELHAETGLTQAERETGFVLACSRTATTDVVLEASVLSGVVLPKSANYPCKINTLGWLSGDVRKVGLRLPPGKSLPYFPGQYVDIARRDGIRRSYSLANAPREDNTLELHVRRVPGGAMSDYWFDAVKEGDLLQLHGPYGSFFLRDVAGKQLVLLATGTGFAPVKAMLEGMSSLAGDALPSQVLVLWGGRITPDLYEDVERFGNLPGFEYVPVLSRADASWQGQRGHVQDVFLRLCNDFSATRVYACGSDAMIAGARATLLAAGLAEKDFHADAFLCSS